MASQLNVPRDGGQGNEDENDADIDFGHDNGEVEEQERYITRGVYEADEAYEQGQPRDPAESEYLGVDDTDFADSDIAADENHDAAIEATGFMEHQEARILARNAIISPSTHALLSYFQTHFFESTPKTTLHTQRIKSGDVRGAKLIRIKYVPAPNEFAYYYAWFSEGDVIDDVAQEWAVILWGEFQDRERVSDYVPFLRYNGAWLPWRGELDGVEMGETIVHD